MSLDAIREYGDGQWWFKELTSLVDFHGTAEQRRAVHGVLRSLLTKIAELPAAPAPLTDEQSAWLELGPAIDRYHIVISAPETRVHRIGGNSPGWGPSGCWGGTAWKHGIASRPASHSKASALEVVRDLVAQIEAGKRSA